jgi:hypothetical protein
MRCVSSRDVGRGREKGELEGEGNGEKRESWT